MMYNKSLLGMICWAWKLWRWKKRASKEIRAWLTRDCVEVDDEPRVHVFSKICISLLQSALRKKADELIIFHRTLRGNHEWETKEEFWDPVAFLRTAWLSPTISFSEESLAHCFRYRDMARVEGWLVHQEKAKLDRTFQIDLGQRILGVFESCLKRVYHVTVNLPTTGPDGQNSSKARCTIGPYTFRPGGMYFIPFQWEDNNR